VVENVFKDDLQICNDPHRIVRPSPPKKVRLTKGEGTQQRLIELLRAIDDRVFASKAKSYSVFKQFDIDGDGYINMNDLSNGLAAHKIPHTEQDVKTLMLFLDRNRNGYVDYNEFAAKV
jgi:hypothetical protein